MILNKTYFFFTISVLYICCVCIYVYIYLYIYFNKIITLLLDRYFEPIWIIYLLSKYFCSLSFLFLKKPKQKLNTCSSDAVVTCLSSGCVDLWSSVLCLLWCGVSCCFRNSPACCWGTWWPARATTLSPFWRWGRRRWSRRLWRLTGTVVTWVEPLSETSAARWSCGNSGQGRREAWVTEPTCCQTSATLKQSLLSHVETCPNCGGRARCMWSNILPVISDHVHKMHYHLQLFFFVSKHVIAAIYSLYNVF